MIIPLSSYCGKKVKAITTGPGCCTRKICSEQDPHFLVDCVVIEFEDGNRLQLFAQDTVIELIGTCRASGCVSPNL